MNDKTSATRLRRLGGTLFALFSLVIAWISLPHVIAPQEPLVGRVLGLLACMGITLPISAAAIWLWTTERALDQSDVLRTLGWCCGGMVPPALFAGLTVIYERQHGVSLAEPLLIVIWVSGVGTVGGLFTAIYDIRRRTAYRDQQATAERLSSLIQAVPVPVIEHGLDGTVRRWNEAAEQTLGWTADEIRGETLPFIPDTSTDEYSDLVERVREDGQLENVEIRRETKDGELRDFLLSTAPIYGDGTDGISSIIGVLVDITEQNQRRERLELFRTLLDHSNDSIFVIDPGTGRFIDVNETACRKLGYDLDELLEKSVPEVEVTLADSEQWSDHVETIRNKGSSVFEGEHRCKDGSTFPVEVNIAYVSVEEHDYIVAIARDITDRKTREQELKRYRKAIEHAGHAIYITDSEGTIEYANPAFEEITGYAPTEVIGEDPSILKSGEHDESYYRRLWNTVCDGNAWDEEIIDQRKSGELYTAHQTIAPIHDDGSIDGFVAVQSDETDRQVRNQRLTVLNRILRHNLRNDVNVIAGRAKALARELENEELQDHAIKIKDRAWYLEQLSEKAQTVTKGLDNTRKPVRPIPVNEVVRDVAQRFEECYPSANIEIDDIDGRAVFVDASVRPALEELVENAIVHCDRPSQTVRIAATVESDTGRVSIVVADNGPGIPSTERTALRNGTETPLLHSRGLGLWLVKWVVTSLGGKVTIDDNEPRGSVVSVSIPPVSAGAAEELASGSVSDSQRSSQRRRNSHND